MIKNKVTYIFLLTLLMCSGRLSAQINTADSINHAKDHLVISYLLQIDTDDRNGVAESYNGAVKTIFLNKKQARSRMVSLMRVQSIFYSNGSEKKITVVKESGKDSYKKKLTTEEWELMNNKYKNATYEHVEDSLEVLNYLCKKAIIHLQDGKKIIAYYTPTLQNDMITEVEPAFKDIPGLVLKYEYENKDAKFVYTANVISFNPTGPEIYKIP